MFAGRGMLVSLLLSTPVAAQTVADLRACGVAAESTTAVLAVRTRAREARARVPEFFTAVFADEVAARVKLPAPLEFAEYSSIGGRPGQPGSWRYLGAAGTYEVVLRRRGVAASPRVVSSSESAALDTALLAAIAEAVAQPALSALPDDVRGDEIAFRVDFTTTDSVRGAWVPLRPIVTSRVALERSVIPIRGAVPLYPEPLRKDGIEGEATLDFVVARDGMADQASARVVETSDPAFAQAAMAALSDLRFRPARVRGCAVSMRVRQPFNFRLGR